MLEEHLKKFVNHLPPANDLQIFHVFSQNHTWIIALEDWYMESAVYCLNTL